MDGNSHAFSVRGLSQSGAREGRDAISPFPDPFKTVRSPALRLPQSCAVQILRPRGTSGPPWDASRRSTAVTQRHTEGALVQVFPHSFKIDARLPKAVAAPVQPRAVRLAPLPLHQVAQLVLGF